MKTSLKKCIRADSNFITLIPPCQFVRCWQIFLEFPEGAAGRLWGCEVVGFKNGLPGADSILFHTVTTHQPFF